MKQLINKILWSGLADKNYYNVIAKYCLPSWIKLPGNKQVIHDAASIDIPSIDIVDWQQVPNLNSKFLKSHHGKKSQGFWRKMQSQVWTVRQYQAQYDFIVLLDTDIEILDFDHNMFEAELKMFSESNLVWATGESYRRGHDSGFIIINCKHPTVNKLLDYYENIWESGVIHTLKKPYDGDAVESMFEWYPSYKIMNADYGQGFHVYDLGLVHYGSKLPKSLRASFSGSGADIVKEYTKDKIVKKLKK